MGFSKISGGGGGSRQRPPAGVEKKRRESLLAAAKAGGQEQFWFETYGEQLLENGWCIYPETNDAPKRMPASPTGNGTIRPVTEERMDRQLPSADTVRYWCTSKGTFSKNTALLTGDGSGGKDEGVWVLDADILDPVTAEAIIGIADEVFGRSPFLRVCNAPKFAIPFRRPLGKLQLTKKNFELAERYHDKPQSIEIKDGTAFTIYGAHSVTGQAVRWIRECNPLEHTPADLLVETEEKTLEFLRRVHERFPILKFDGIDARTFEDGASYADTDVSEVRKPKYIAAKILPAPDTKLDSNRKQGFLLPRSVSWAVLNAGIVAPQGSDGTRAVSREGCCLVARAMAEEARDYIEIGIQKNDDVTERTIQCILTEMLRTAAVKIVSGEFKPVGTERVVEQADGTKTSAPERQHVVQTDSEFSWLPNPRDRSRITGITMSAPDADKAKERAPLPDRRDLMESVSEQVIQEIRDWLLAVWRWVPEGKEPMPTIVLKAPTGAGKTTALIKVIGWFKKTYPTAKLGPILLLLPSYENIAEIEGREDLGIWTEATQDRADDIIEEADGFGLSVMTFKGKLAAGCLEEDKVRELMAQGISSSGLCYSKRKERVGNGPQVETVERWCRFHPDNPNADPADEPCPAIMQQRLVEHHDLVLAPHAFIHTNIPEALKNVRAVVIDEKIWDKVTGNVTIPLSTFEIVRGAPLPTKKERMIDPDFDTYRYVESRTAAVEVLLDALRRRVDPAAALLDHEVVSGTVTKTGMQLVEETMHVTGRNQRTGFQVIPGMSLGKVKELIGQPAGAKISEEHRAWKLVLERLEALQHDRANMLAGTPQATARGSRDLRLLHVTDMVNFEEVEGLRIAWRSKKNFEDKPILFLDASGDLDILKKHWSDRPIIEREIQASQHVRCVMVPDATYSKSMILPDAGDDDEDMLQAKALRRTLLREAVQTAGMAYGFGGVVAAGAMKVRTFLADGWPSPHNVDWLHYGATRGIDFAKHHSAAVAIGSLDLSLRDRDAYVAALSYDDPEPETLADAFGTGREGGSGKWIKPTRGKVTVPLRDGGDMTIADVPLAMGKWARKIQEQVREQELSQFLGRLRGVYRTGRAPVAIVLGKVLPPGYVVDEVICLGDLARPLGRSTRSLEAVRQSGGIVCPGTSHPFFRVATETSIEKMLKAFASNPRLAEGFHELAYTLDCSREELRAWADASFPGDPVERLRERMDFKSARVVRQARMAAFQRPGEVHKIDEILGTREERAAAEAEAFEQLFQRIEWKLLDFDEKRLGIRSRRVTMEPDSFITYEQMLHEDLNLEAEASEKEYEQSAANSTSLPDQPTPDPVPVAIVWSAATPAAPANVNGLGTKPLVSLRNIVPLRPPKPPERRGFGSITNASAGSG